MDGALREVGHPFALVDVDLPVALPAGAEECAVLPGPDDLDLLPTLPRELLLHRRPDAAAPTLGRPVPLVRDLVDLVDAVFGKRRVRKLDDPPVVGVRQALSCHLLRLGGGLVELVEHQHVGGDGLEPHGGQHSTEVEVGAAEAVGGRPALGRGLRAATPPRCRRFAGASASYARSLHWPPRRGRPSLCSGRAGQRR